MRRKTRTSVLFCLLLLSSCGLKRDKEFRYFKPSKDQFNKVINNPSGQIDLNKDIYLYTNEDYPIELALYEDGTYYYDIQQLGEGKGTWKYESGALQLTNFRYFAILGRDVEMNYEIKALDEQGTQLQVVFRDRFGLKNYPLSIKNR